MVVTAYVVTKNVHMSWHWKAELVPYEFVNSPCHVSRIFYP
jgi:hypothetical protein